MHRTLPLVAAVILLGGCPGSDPRAVFERDVVPVLESTCAASTCHGVAPGAEADGEVIDRRQLFFDVDEAGHLTNLDAAYETAREAIDPIEPAVLSSLLRKPLAESFGGLPHRGGDNFLSPDADAVRALAAWIEGETHGGETVPPLTNLEQQFADEVQPVLFGLTCANGNCHGLSAAIPYRLDPGVGGVVGPAQTRANYVTSRRMLALTGDPVRSRLLTKSLPLHAGGIVHKGGNVSFLDDLDDARAGAILDWACAEREEATGASCESPAEGIVFVRGPLDPGEPFDLDRYAPGSDLWWVGLDGGGLTNLTADLHDAAVDIRDPAVDATGTRVAFALRGPDDDGHALWHLDLLTGEGGPLTDPAVGSDRDPAWVGDDAVWFASTRAGEPAHQGRFLDSDLYALGLDSGEVRRRTWTPHAERMPIELGVGKVAGEVVFSTLRDAVAEDASGQLFRFPPDLHVEYHVHFGITPPEDLLLGVAELPDGRYATTLGSLAGVWDAGRIGILDRNFGPEIQSKGPVEESALPFYSAPLVRLDPQGRSAGVAPRIVREVTALPDGRLVAAVADGPVDLADPEAVFDLRLEILDLREQPDGSGPSIVARSVLVDAPGVHDHDPQPVLVRPSPPSGAPRDWTAERGLFLHNGLPLNDAILSSLEPVGAKPLVADRAVAVRLVEAVPGERIPVPSDETRDGHAGATSASLSVHPAARILAELPLAPDGTFAADVPAGVPFRLQTLDARGLAVGAMHNRWYDLSPGQVIKQGVGHGNPRFYGAQCAGCHGALDGEPAGAFIEPDVMTTATVTLSRFDQGDPRRPLTPPSVGSETRERIDFVEDIQPLLVEACSGCHDSAAALSLTATPTAWFTDAYESLLAPGTRSGGGYAYVDAGRGSAFRSYLVEVLLGEELEAPGELPSPGPRHGELTDVEIGLITRWIDLGATFVGAP